MFGIKGEEEEQPARRSARGKSVRSRAALEENFTETYREE